MSVLRKGRNESPPLRREVSLGDGAIGATEQGLYDGSLISSDDARRECVPLHRWSEQIREQSYHRLRIWLSNLVAGDAGMSGGACQDEERLGPSWRDKGCGNDRGEG